MVNPSKRKGTEWETRLLSHLREVFPHAFRSPPAGSKDIGDFVNTGVWCIEAKAHKQFDLAGWVDEARVEAARCGPDVVPVVIAPRRNHPARRAYVVMELGDWLNVAHRLEHP